MYNVLFETTATTKKKQNHYVDGLYKALFLCYVSDKLVLRDSNIYLYTSGIEKCAQEWNYFFIISFSSCVYFRKTYNWFMVMASHILLFIQSHTNAKTVIYVLLFIFIKGYLLFT